MLSNIPRLYTSPKWQAAITDPSKKFYARDGSQLSSLWDLKQFLKNCNQETLDYHVAQTHNHIADWVEKCVGDYLLAQQLRETTTRWGMIVGLERHMMRTVDLPKFVARRYLKRAHQPFIFQNGTCVYSLDELSYVLQTISEKIFKYHNDKKPSDISLWIMHIIGDAELAEIINRAASLREAQFILTDYLQKLRNIVNG